MKLFPILCGASFKNKGVQPLLDAVIDYLPSPLDIPPIQGIIPRQRGEERKAVRRRAVRGAGVQIMTTSTSASSSSCASTRNAGGGRRLNSTKDKKSAFGRCSDGTRTRRRRSRPSAAETSAAAIGAQAHDDRRHAVASRPFDLLGVDDVPRAVIAVAIEPKTGADEEKLGTSLARLALEDPTFR